ncbi:shikimate dehydrogenase [Shimazuella alba]|uniref:Shikimate dehydrogenase (NADP(+)) n=1 Tax=Shimazuella alba TaxID=2690964 RepID=A0A6I4VQZ3_9BACL|nr:shikimate dehydrogenase [Shimazuella alba]MXQ53513.1 shikimate dehydrogenase [Shimazuella alba]
MNITANTRPLGLLGYPVTHSKSPQILNEVCRILGIPATYMAYSVCPDHLKEAVNGMRVLNFIGFNVTIPHKVAIIPYLDELDETAEEIGAVNTVLNKDGKLIGYNTDGVGYLRSLQEETAFSLKNKIVTILGAGGAARAVSITLAKAGAAKVFIANRTQSKAEELANVLGTFTSASAVALLQAHEKIAESHLLVNTTSIGMSPHTEVMPVPADYLHPKLLVSDLIYRPEETKLLLSAKQIGARTHGGLGMLLHQAAVAVEHWFNETAPILQMRAILENED